MTKKSMRDGEHITVPTDSPTAPAAVSQSQHASVPWRVFDEAFPNHHFPGIEAPEYSVVIWGNESDGQGVRGRTAEEAGANAAFIVRAVNHHEALLAALEAAEDYLSVTLGDCDADCECVLHPVRAAIANAKEK